MQLYDETTIRCSRLITETYSTSFTLGIKTLAPALRPEIFAIYGFVRFADEIVDTFHGHDRRILLEEFRSDTWKAIDRKISLNPVLHAFQQVVNQHSIPKEYIEAFLASMAMDLDFSTYDDSKYSEYIYGSAEVVGLMCLKVFCTGDTAMFDTLVHPARMLGSAFQKVNFLRDMKSDFEERGRVYFPNVSFRNFSTEEKEKIEADIAHDFSEGRKGISNLPSTARMGVMLAYIYYQKLFERIQRSPAAQIKTTRVRLPNSNKMLLMAKTYLQYRLGTI